MGRNLLGDNWDPVQDRARRTDIRTIWTWVRFLKFGEKKKWQSRIDDSKRHGQSDCRNLLANALFEERDGKRRQVLVADTPDTLPSLVVPVIAVDPAVVCVVGGAIQG